MDTFLVYLLLIIYVIGIFIYVSTEVKENFKFHEGGFLGLGYTTNDTREATVKDVWKGLIWPILILLYLLKATIWIINEDVIPLICLVVNFKYKRTKMYKFIEKNTE